MAARKKTKSDQGVLVVDLDGTLVRTDMLHESFWSAFSRQWHVPLVAAAGLASGRARLKEKLAAMAEINPASLPYNEEVLAYIRRWREAGGRTALVTASDQRIAASIAAHLGLFDEVHGSDGANNLKGAAKAAFIARHFAGTPVTYMGDAPADLPVWKETGRAVTVNAPQALRGRVEALGGSAEHLGSMGRGLKPYVKALRPHQWLKNVLVFVPMLAAHRIDFAAFWQTCLALIIFSLVASSVYVLNDLLDLAADRSHPRKRLRPLASGSLPIARGSLMAPLLLMVALLLALPLGLKFIAVMAGYYVSTLAYSLYLKRQLIIDICLLAGLYTLRIVAGSAATDIPLSVWLLAFSVFFFFSLAALKRQAELVDGVAAGKVTAHGRGYHVGDLPIVSSMAIASGYLSVLVMAFYLNSPAVRQLYDYPAALWGTCLVLLYWISRMVMKTHRGKMHDDPVVFAVTDNVSRFCLILMFGFTVAGVRL